ncbi:fatty acid-binding protein 5-like [Echinops telfairi]|uniref:Fatty acid-binding protein 5-like n=1 Tax=Echinops telfairi TaxID=9371 RepID=A0AC55CJG5_ECHTE|nr:fatty acid-binding protein 5-like [Echinops telfairi]
MTPTQQLLESWCLTDSKGFDEHMKELGVGMALQPMSAMAKPDCAISTDGKTFTRKPESTLKPKRFSCNLEENFEETDGRKTQTVFSLMHGVWVQRQVWDMKESAIQRTRDVGTLVT